MRFTNGIYVARSVTLVAFFIKKRGNCACGVPKMQK